MDKVQDQVLALFRKTSPDIWISTGKKFLWNLILIYLMLPEMIYMRPWKNSRKDLTLIYLV